MCISLITHIFTGFCVSQFNEEHNVLQVVEAGRDIKVMIAVTMYNEDATEMAETLTKIGRNIKYMQNHHVKSADFGHLGAGVWRSIVTTIVCDGRQKMNGGTMKWLHDIGLLDESAMHVALLGDARPQLHLFEGSVELTRDAGATKSELHMPIQIQIGIKEHNAGKVSGLQVQ